MKNWQTTLAAGAAALWLAPAVHAELSANPKVAQTQAALRGLWSGHVFWVRNVVVETLAHDAAGAAVAEKEVVDNARQIAGAIKPFYGQAASDKLFELLAGHYGAVKQYLVASARHNKRGEDAAYQALTGNVDELAGFLSSANPYLPKATLQSLLLAHGGHHVQQIRQLEARQYGDEARTWAAMSGHMDAIADALGGALARQFPDRF